jgi:hypothetical protein
MIITLADMINVLNYLLGIKSYIWSIPLYGAVAWAHQKVDQKYLGSSEMWCWPRLEKNSWTNRARDEEVLDRIKEERNVLHTTLIKGREE